MLLQNAFLESAILLQKDAEATSNTDRKVSSNSGQ